MGRRYSAILAYMGIEFEGIDLGEKPSIAYDGVIVCTPTVCHPDDIEYYCTGAAVLCEKPISKEPGVTKSICRTAKAKGWALRMVNQYEYLIDPSTTGPSLYDYYRTGNDTLPWDCCNIIGLSTGPIYLGNRSPVWNCAINGQVLKIADMDSAYIKMIRSWISGDHQNIDYILKAHEKVIRYIEAQT